MCKFIVRSLDNDHQTNVPIDAVLSFATIALGLQVPRIKDSRTQQIAVFIWALVLFGMYGFLMSIFRIKNGGYPFWLPPF